MMEFANQPSAPASEGAWRRQQETLDRVQEAWDRELDQRAAAAIADMVSGGEVGV